MIGVIVLAAGHSRRMGTQKLLLPLAGKPVIACVVDELRRSRLHRIVAVVGPDGEKIRQALGNGSVEFVNNADIAGDMLSSIRCGLRALSSECSGILIVLGDQPNLTSHLIKEMIEQFHSGCGIVVPTHLGHRGHPVLIAGRFREELLTRHEDVGLRGLLNSHPEEVYRLEVPESVTLEDMDTPEDYRRHLNAVIGRNF